MSILKLNCRQMLSKKLIEELISLPVEGRALIVDSILRSLNPAESDIYMKWIKVAKERLKELKSGKNKAVPRDEVFKKLCKEF